MTASVALLAFILAMAVLGPTLLRRCGWLDRSPLLGILAWQSLTASLVLAAVLAGFSLAVPTIPWTTDVASLLEACAMALQARYATPGGAAVSATGAVLAITVIMRIGYCLIRRLLAARKTRGQQLDALGMVARRHQSGEALVVEHSAAAAYCLPGRHQRIVFTTAALDALDDAQFAAVLAHERAHLRGRHHLILAGAEALQHASPRVSVFRTARAEIFRLVEMLADDQAVRNSPRLTVAAALVRLAERSAAPAATLAAGGETVLMRVQRLSAPADPLGPARATAATAALFALIAVPVAVLAVPAMGAGLPCPTGPCF
ncbi:M56 family metallopeptidase [Arthrobacter castelli]|uniref:M56 family metallopeptidase n=1 Tax=Arthrobacter castelli TaxID=271431 RepID=UPI000401BFA5|nr:M56 family metallopeptidase [Arthrobacter castelli]